MISLSFEDLPQDVLIRINDLCNEFEEHWSDDPRPALESLVAGIDERYQLLLIAELIALDAELRHREGQQVVHADYAARFPQLDPTMLSEIVASAISYDAESDSAKDGDSLNQGQVASHNTKGSVPAADASLSALRRQLVDAAICSDSEVTQMVDGTSLDEPGDDRTRIVEALRNDSRLTDYQADILAGRESGVLSLGEYTLLEQLGAGGMGTVFKAVHRRMHRVVALKILKSDYQRNRRFRERFQREVFAAARLSHPGIVTAFDAGESDGIPYLVTEYVPAHDLGQIIKDSGPLSVSQAVEVLQQTAAALEYAHQQGVIHRDVKPGNLLLDHSGTVKVLDVGLSRLVQDSAAVTDDRPDITNTGFVMGTAEYISPEQAMDGRSADERSDVYSLGCTLFTLLSGKPCYPADTPVARMLAHRDEPVPQLTAVRSDVPDWLNDVFQRMVAKDPAERFQSMTELLRILQKDQPAAPASLGRRPVSTRRAAGPAWSTVVLAVVCLGGIPALIWGSGLFSGTVEDTTADGEQREQLDRSPGKGPGMAVEAADRGPQKADAPFSASEARALQTAWAEHLGIETSFVDELTGIEFVLIPPGSFLMGSTDEEVVRVLTTDFISDPMKRCAFRSEAPQRSTEIDRPFYMARTETTYAQFRQFVEQSGYTTVAEKERIGYGLIGDTFEQAAPGEQHFHWNYYGGIQPSDNDPVGNLTWVDATAFCRHYSEGRSDRYYRLPFEREWEFACRAGSVTTWCFGDDPDELRRYGVCRPTGRSGHRRAEEVAQRRPNAFGLYDMHGNLSEWCDDVFDWRDEELMLEAFSAPYELLSNQSRYGVTRGGSINSYVAATRSAARQANNRFNHCNSFRVVLEIPEDGR